MTIFKFKCTCCRKYIIAWGGLHCVRERYTFDRSERINLIFIWVVCISHPPNSWKYVRCSNIDQKFHVCISLLENQLSPFYATITRIFFSPFLRFVSALIGTGRTSYQHHNHVSVSFYVAGATRDKRRTEPWVNRKWRGVKAVTAVFPEEECESRNYRDL